MDDRDDFEEKMEEDEIDALDEEDRILGLGLDDDGIPLEDDEDEEKSRLDNFFQHEGEEEEPLGY